MGAMTFDEVGVGTTPQEAFEQARDRALWEYGHAGYTGTIAEKHDFKLFARPTDLNFHEIVIKALNGELGHISKIANDKWGPAAAIELTADEWKIPAGSRAFVFFGWASC